MSLKKLEILRDALAYDIGELDYESDADTIARHLLTLIDIVADQQRNMSIGGLDRIASDISAAGDKLEPTAEDIKPEPQTDLEKFRAAIAGKDYLILDTETTGLHEGEIIQIAIINSAGDTLLNSYVKPVEPIPADSRRIHGISDEMVADAPTWKELAPKVREILDGQLLIVYNATYDRKMMHQSAERSGMDKIEWKEIAEWHCAMIAFAELYGEWNDWHGNYRWKRLTDAARYCAVPVDAAHDALGDCLMTLGVVRHMIKGGA